MHVTNRRRTAESLQPARPPACRGKMRMDQFGLSLSGVLSKNVNGERVELTADGKWFGVDAQSPHFSGCTTTAFDHRCVLVSAGLHLLSESHQLHLGARHVRRCDDLHHAARRAQWRQSIQVCRSHHDSFTEMKPRQNESEMHLYMWPRIRAAQYVDV